MANKEIEIKYETHIVGMPARMTAIMSEAQVRRVAARSLDGSNMSLACLQWVADNPETKTVREILGDDERWAEVRISNPGDSRGEWVAMALAHVAYGTTVEEAFANLLDMKVPV